MATSWTRPQRPGRSHRRPPGRRDRRDSRAGNVDAVLIASSTDTHLDLLVRAVEAGKAVLCEKPIDLDLAKVDASWARIQARRPTIMVGFNRRFDASFKALRDRIQAGEIGKLEQVVITSRDPAAADRLHRGLGWLVSRHDHPRLRHGPLPDGRHRGGARDRGDLVDPAIQQAGDIDAAMVTMVAKSGALCQISNSRRCAYGYDQRIEVFGENGMLQAGNQHPTTLSFWGAAACGARPGPPFSSSATPAYLAEIDHFVDCIEKGRRRSWATATAVRRCGWPMPLWKACGPVGRSGSTSPRLRGRRRWPICC